MGTKITQLKLTLIFTDKYFIDKVSTKHKSKLTIKSAMPGLFILW